jgi:hypothetical protein
LKGSDYLLQLRVSRKKKVAVEEEEKNHYFGAKGEEIKLNKKNKLRKM